MTIFVIRDEWHSGWHGEFPDIQGAFTELRRRAEIPWDQDPNRAPCTNWRNCGHLYQIVEFDNSCDPWKEVRSTDTLDISAKGVKWLHEIEDGG
jgi:hypothetical protein